jgi:ketosteroid isomerase-like protein
MSDLTQTHLATIRQYYAACNSGDEAQFRATLSADVVHYFLPSQLQPVRGVEHFIAYWRKNRERYNAQWSLDRTLAQGDEAVVEWTMRWTPAPGGERLRMRGAEWYQFRQGRINEVRAYCGFDANGHTELAGFPYEARGLTD